MLSDDRLEFIKKILDDGMIVKHSMRLWKGSISFNCHENDVNHWRGEKIIQASRYRLTCQRKYHMKEFKTANAISNFFYAFCKSYCYRTRYGIFVPRQYQDMFFEKHLDAKRRALELRDIMLDEKDRIIEELKEQYVPVAHDMWQRRYGGGDPTQGYVNTIVQMYVDKFPSDNKIKSMYNVETYQIDPFMKSDQIISKHLDKDNHNMQVYREFYDAILSRRQSSRFVVIKFLEEIKNRPDGDRRFMRGLSKRIFNKMMGYMNCMYYDEDLHSAISDLCDLVVVSDDNRTRGNVINSLDRVLSSIDLNRMLLMRV